MFELSIARKYLIPKRKQLSVSLIAVLSVAMISLVVWLVLVFLSVTEGIERSWLDKLTSLNAPLRITPTENYYSSYYYLSDGVSAHSDYSLKTIGEKARASRSDPYAPESDPELPYQVPLPDKRADGSLVDPVKDAFAILQDLKTRQPDIAFQDFEVSGAMMRLQFLRATGRGAAHSFLTQVSYLASFSDQSPYLRPLLQPPSAADLNHLFFLAGHQLGSVRQDVPHFASSGSKFSERLASLLENMEIEEIKVLKEGEPLFVKAKLLPESLRAARSFRDLRFKTAGLGEIPWEGVEISKAAVKTHFDSAPALSPPWVHTVGDKLVLPEGGVILAKGLRENGARIGDPGYFSYQAAAASSIQEQRLPLYVAGFYDPGVMAVGSRCILVHSPVAHTINASSNSFSFDRTASNGILVWFKDAQRALEMKQQLISSFEKAGIAPYWKVQTFHDYDFAKDLMQQFQSDKYLFTLIALIILIVACTNIISLLVLLVNNKKREIGILQAMGASSKSIAMIFGFTGMAMGLLSSLLGIASAAFTLHHIDKVVRLLSFLQGHDAFHAAFYGASLPNTLSSGALLFVLIATPLLSLCAGLVPAIKACRLRPSAILRSE